MKTIIKILIAILLIGCCFKVPYGYFQYARIVGFLGFGYLAYDEFKNKKNILIILFCINCAILLNPIEKIHFPRYTWNIIDIILAIILIAWILIEALLRDKKA